jgi:hypothetical protein
MEQLQEFLIAVSQQCEAQGMTLPFIVCSVAANHSVLVIRINEGADVPDDVLAEHLEDDRFVLPINIMVIGQNNTAARDRRR